MSYNDPFGIDGIEDMFEPKIVSNIEDTAVQIMDHLGDRDSCVFVDDDCETWEVRRIGINSAMAISLAHNSIVRIKKRQSVI